MTIPKDCPIQQHQTKIVDLSKDMVRTIRKLRRDLQSCPECDNALDCPILQTFNASVNEAINTITDEWNLAETIIRS